MFAAIIAYETGRQEMVDKGCFMQKYASVYGNKKKLWRDLKHEKIHYGISSCHCINNYFNVQRLS